MGLDKFLDLLASNELFFSNASQMSDQYEGVIPRRNEKYILKELKNEGLEKDEAQFESQTRLNQANSLRASTLLNCWTINQHESYALWKIYLSGSKSGVAIKTTVSKLERAINNGNDPYDEDIFMSRVNYTNFIKDEPESRFNIITTKNKFYEYENELRLFIFNYPRSEGGTKTPYDISVGRRVRIDIDELIDEIYLSPFTGQWFDKTLIETIGKFNPELKKKIRNSEILDE
ncbi:MAG: hypothetical protein AAF193_11860 [Bacteroidota bacterium]